MSKIDNSIIEKLQETLGLSLNEARVYYSFFVLSDGSASDHSEFTELPRSRIYESQSKLAAKNLIEKNSVIGGYRVIPPNKSIRNMMEDLKHSYDHKRQSMERMRNYLDDLWRGHIVRETEVGVHLIPAHSVEQFIIKDIRDIKDRMLIAVASTNPIIDWSNITNELIRVIQRQPTVKYLVFNKDIAERLEQTMQRKHNKIMDFIKIKTNNDLYISFLLIDTVSYLFIFTTESMITPMVLRSVSSELTKALTWMFNKLWEN